MIPKIAERNATIGSVRTRALSAMPHRLTAVIKMRPSKHIASRWWLSEGNADRDGQHVVHDQARGRQQTDCGSQILLAHRIRATAVGVQRDHLAVGDDQHGEQARDGHGDQQRQAQRRRAGRYQHQHDGCGPYATELSASSDSAASPPKLVR
jgi:hypothetical protein